MTQQDYNLVRLAQVVRKFESAARLEIEVRWRTSGTVQLSIRDMESDMRQTHKFSTVLQAVEWVQEAL